ncbi:MAG: class I SAM-dependent methyltransferase [Methanomassiliicoccus sp.]|nr:class I SAM-dependent methyltransferase [Methanomassiliicoccus sp.]
MNERIREHWDADSRSYNEFVTKGFSIHRERRAWQGLFAEVIGPRGLSVLDVGCGPGIVSMQLADMGHRVTSLDFSEKMLEAARKNAADNGLSIDIRHGDAEALPFDDNAFDALISDYVLWTLPHPERALREWYRVVRPGSTVVYVDGNWRSDPRSTWWRVRLSNMGVFLDSPPKYLRTRGRGVEAEKAMDELWSTRASRPSTDVDMMRAAGFGDVRVIHNIQDRVLHGVRHLAYGSTNDHFMVMGVKPGVRSA